MKPGVATLVGTERGQIAQIAPKWLGESAKGSLGLRHHQWCGSAEKVFCTGAKEVCTGANRASTSTGASLVAPCGNRGRGRG